MISTCSGLQVEEPLRLDGLQPFVHQAGAVDGDLGTHVPVGVLQRLRLGVTAASSVACHPTERTTAGGEHDLLDRVVPLPRHALEDGTVLAVHRIDIHAVLRAAIRVISSPATTKVSLLARAM
jgi:hypothetical protein